MFEKQKQATGEGGTSLQAGNDIKVIQNIGLQFSEVKEIFHLLLSENFPKLREIACQTATQNIENYLEKFEHKFAQNFNRIDVEKIKDPDIQFSFNEVVEASARKGEKTDSDVLSELLIERMSKTSNDFISIVSSEGIKIVPKLTAEHISFISLVHYLSSVQHTGLTDPIGLEEYASMIVGLTDNSFNLSRSNKQYLQFTGVLTSLNFSADDFKDITKNRYDFLKNIGNEELERTLEQKAPSYKKLMDIYISCEIYNIRLTAVGQMIALANLKRVLGNLDYSIWIN